MHEYRRQPGVDSDADGRSSLKNYNQMKQISREDGKHTDALHKQGRTDKAAPVKAFHFSYPPSPDTSATDRFPTGMEFTSTKLRGVKSLLVANGGTLFIATSTCNY